MWPVRTQWTSLGGYCQPVKTWLPSKSYGGKEVVLPASTEYVACGAVCERQVLYCYCQVFVPALLVARLSMC